MVIYQLLSTGGSTSHGYFMSVDGAKDEAARRLKEYLALYARVAREEDGADLLPLTTELEWSVQGLFIGGPYPKVECLAARMDAAYWFYIKEIEVMR